MYTLYEIYAGGRLVPIAHGTLPDVKSQVGGSNGWKTNENGEEIFPSASGKPIYIVKPNR